jgi:hypothetical protein
MIRSVLGVDVRARNSKYGSDNYAYNPFQNPIIHKQINGEEIVPINLSKLWNK